MMQNILRCFLACIVLTLASCQKQSESVTQTTPKVVPSKPSVLDIYLKQVFGERISDKEHWYIIIPAVGCTGCGVMELQWLAKQPAYSPEVTLITSGLLRELTRVERLHLAEKVSVQADTLFAANSVLDRLKLPFPTLTGVVHVQQGQTPEYISFDKDSYEAVLAQLPHQ